MNVWDYYRRQNAPIMTTKVYDCGISSISVQPRGRKVAIGSDDGSVSILEMSSALYETPEDEKIVISNMLDRETRREKNLEMRQLQRQRNIKERARELANVKPPFDPEAAWPEETQKSIEEAVAAFDKIMADEEAREAREADAAAAAAAASGAAEGAEGAAAEEGEAAAEEPAAE